MLTCNAKMRPCVVLAPAAWRESGLQPGPSAQVPPRTAPSTNLQPAALAERGEVDAGRGIPSARAIARTELHRDVLVAVGNVQRRFGCGIGRNGCEFGPVFARRFPRRRRSRRGG